MERGRRHACDFTDSLNKYTDSFDVHSDMYSSISRDSLETRSSKHSVILAGCSKADSISNTPISFIGSTVPAPDLNKCIDLFQSGSLKDDNKENENLQFRTNDKQPLNAISRKLINEVTSTTSKENKSHSCEKPKHDTMNKTPKRDTNHNINKNKFNAIAVSEVNVLKPVAVSQPTSLSKSTTKETPISSTDGGHAQFEDELNKFESVLCFLDNQLNQIKEVSQPQQLLKRLSEKYSYAPHSFTERLLTIIEESVINNSDDTRGISAINLSRLTTEFRKLCKFIEDESIPEWPPSPLSPPSCTEQVLGTPTCNKSVHANDCKNASPINATSLTTTPLSGIDVIKRRFFQKISKNNFNGSIDNVINLSTNISSTESFERLEAQCKRLFPEETECPYPLRKSTSVPSLLSMTHIQRTCEKQLASLNISNGIDRNPKEKSLSSTPNLLDTRLYRSPSINKLRSSCAKIQPESFSCRKYLSHEKVSYSKTKSKKIDRKSDSNELNSNKAAYDYMALDPDVLEKTLLQDIAEKRKRCLDTARLITEINADPEITGVEKSLELSFMSSTNNESNSLSYDEAQFLKTLTSCKEYQMFLERRKPVFNLLQTSNSCFTPEITRRNNDRTDLQYEGTKGPVKEFLNVKQPSSVKSNILTPNVKPRNICKSPLSKREVKPKLFVTPGKTPPHPNQRTRKVYFPTMYSPGQKSTLGDNIVKSPHAKGLYRLNYNTIISPVGMYIRGTDMKLIKNVRAKKGGLLMSPGVGNVKTVPSIIVTEATPLKPITRTQQKTPYRINLSPKLRTNPACGQEEITAKTPENDTTPKTHFVLPKVSYKLPLQVRTIKKDKSPKAGTRVKKLLESAQSKVVIRHQERTNSIKKKGSGPAEYNQIYEINYEPEDESIHIEQAASKTNFIRRQKNI
ncbi:uncharacterized protein LOC143373062 isoform X2 [Andrena cerasifolii]|uniref:uncharacterized protein LOC143373062 isoform X2 n=1 Tax=Andrena cerasifolii TaxID=2819439 RepID=UPI004037B9FF